MTGFEAEQGHPQPRLLRTWLHRHLLRLATVEAAAADGVGPASGRRRRPRVRGRRRRIGPRGIPGFVIRRVLLGLLTLLVVSVVVFAATQALPGDPAQAILGRNADAGEPRHAARAARPRPAGRASSTSTGSAASLTGDLGNSLAAGVPVSELLGDRIVNSAFLVLISALISIPLSIAIGAYAALRRDGVVRPDARRS